MREFIFNTGVHISNNPKMSGAILSPNQVWVIPFQCENVPENAIFKFASDYTDLRPYPNWIVREIHNSTLISKYAYFQIP